MGRLSIAERSGWQRLQLMAYSSAPVSGFGVSSPGLEEAADGEAPATGRPPLTQPLPKARPAAVKIASTTAGRSRSRDVLIGFIALN